MPDLIHLQFRPRGRDHHVIIISVIPGIDLPRRAHRLQIDGETAPQVTRRGQLQVNFRVKQGLREWFMVPVRQARICLAMLLPDRVQARSFIKCGCQSCERYHVRSIRWQLSFLHLGKKIRRISQIQCQRDVLRQIPRRVGTDMLVIVLTHHVAGFESIVRIVRRPVDLAPNLFPNRVGNVQFLVISAGGLDDARGARVLPRERLGGAPHARRPLHARAPAEEALQSRVGPLARGRQAAGRPG